MRRRRGEEEEEGGGGDGRRQSVHGREGESYVREERLKRSEQSRAQQSYFT